MKKIVLAPDSFKGSLNSDELCRIMAEAFRDALGPDVRVVGIPVADGGEGTMDCMVRFLNGRLVPEQVRDPLGRPITASYGVIGSAAVIETAAASGLTLIDKEDRDVMRSSTFGTGELLLHALRSGYKDIYFGLGGSATNDCGMGLAAALGARFLDKDGNELEACPSSFRSIETIDLTGLEPSLSDCNLTIMSDVQNPLLGPEGATAVYGPQKGVAAEAVAPLDAAMARYADLMEHATGKQVRNVPGAGAAGGLGAGLLFLTDPVIRPGIDVVLELAEFDRHLAEADLVITGEGSIDGQSLYGKAVSGIAKRCLKAGVPCVAVVGRKGPGADALLDHGLARIIELGAGLTTEESIARAPELLYQKTRELAAELQ